MSSDIISRDFTPENVSPEAALVANSYLENQCDIQRTADELSLPVMEVTQILNERNVKRHLGTVMMAATVGSMDSITSKMEDIIEKKLTELEEAEITSSKDIVEILNMLHKMYESKAKIVTQQQAEAGPAVQNNTQVNMYDDASGWGRLMGKLANAPTK